MRYSGTGDPSVRINRTHAYVLVCACLIRHEHGCLLIVGIRRILKWGCENSWWRGLSVFLNSATRSITFLGDGVMCAEGRSSYSVRVWVLPTQPQEMQLPLCLSKEPLSPWSPETSVYR